MDALWLVLSLASLECLAYFTNTGLVALPEMLWEITLASVNEDLAAQV